MNPEIKQRIDQIRQGEVPEGYKKTKAGIVPSEWSSFTFGDIYAERKEAGDPELPILTVSIHSGVSDGALDEDEIGKKVKRIEDKTQYKKAHSGDLVFNMMRAWQGAIGVVRTKGLVSPAYIVANPKNSVYPLYMDFYMKTAEVINRIHRKSYGVTDFRLRLYWDSFAIIDCALPPLPEQQKIAEILTMQDKLIELQARKIEQLQALKKAYLQRMFPKKGCDRPEIRFAGFTDAWEQREFNDIFLSFANKNYQLQSNEYHEIGKYPIIDQGKKAIIGYSNNESKVCDKYPCIIFGDHTTELKYIDFPFIVGADGVKTLSVKDGHVLFQYYNLQLNNVQPSGYNRHFSMLKDISFSVPTIKEQQKIGTYFCNFDHLITLHQHKLDEEKQKKKALMQLLLTGIVRAKI